jgi:hypothetical protein
VRAVPIAVDPGPPRVALAIALSQLAQIHSSLNAKDAVRPFLGGKMKNIWRCGEFRTARGDASGAMSRSEENLTTRIIDL